MISKLVSLKQLEALVWVADLGSFRKAAQHLNTTQPNISSRITALERSLGVTLMLRDAGSVRLTETGADILGCARNTLREAQKLTQIAQRADLVEGRLRLGVTELVACTWLHDYLRALKAAYPALAVELTVDLSRTLDTELGSNALDLTIQTAPFSSAASGVIELGDAPYVWAAAAPIDAPLTVKDLIPRTILTHARHTQAFTELADYAKAKSLPTHQFVPSSSMASCVQMALDGMGVTLLPRDLIKAELAKGSLTALEVDWTPSPLRFAARFHADRAAQFVAVAAKIAEDVAAQQRP